MQFVKKCPDDVIFIFNDTHNGNMKLEHFIDIGKDIPKDILLKHLNAVNDQGIVDIKLGYRTYVISGKVLPVYRLSSGERVFLVASIAALTGTKVAIARALEQLSKPVLDRFMETFSEYDNIFIIDPVGYYKAGAVKK